MCSADGDQEAEPTCEDLSIQDHGMHTQENSPGPINDDMEIVDHRLTDPGPARTRPAKQHATAQDWTRYRTIIADLYTRMALKEVIEYMATKYRFFATARMYKSRLREWGLNKYVKAKDMEALVQQAQSRPQDDAATDLEIGGRTVPLAKVARFARRQGQKLPTDIASAIQSPFKASRSLPACITDCSHHISTQQTCAIG